MLADPPPMRGTVERDGAPAYRDDRGRLRFFCCSELVELGHKRWCARRCLR